MTSPLVRLVHLGQSPWLDYISRELLSRDLPHLVEAGEVTGVTSNPSIFEKAISSGKEYDPDIEELARRGLSAEETYEELAVRDVARACDLLAGVHRSSGGRDGFVSLEACPRYACSREGNVRDARQLFARVARPNLMVKVPATPQGLEAVRDLLLEGVNINTTLIFSLSQYRGTAEAYLSGLEDRLEKGQDLARVASVASVFVSRIDTAVDRRLDALGQRALRGKAAVASAKQIYQTYREIFAGSRFEALKEKGARVQRLLWGSTGTKDPAYSDIKYVQELIGRDTINTIPLPTLEAFRDHGAVRLTVEEGLEEARRDLEALSRLGIELEEVGQELQDEGVKAFTRSHDNLVASIEAKRRAFHQGGFRTGLPAG